jgi:hypothetical protein
MIERVTYYGRCVNCSGPLAIEVFDELLEQAWQFDLQHVHCLPILEGGAQ